MSLIYQGSKAFIKSVEYYEENGQKVELGRGGQAIVYKAKLRINQQNQPDKLVDIALKRIQLPKCKINRDRINELIKRELSVYQSIKSPHIIKLYGTNLGNQKLENLEYLEFYLEKCDGNLEDLIINKQTWSEVPFSEDQALQIFGKILEVEFLLEKSDFQRSSGLKQGLYHRDINLKNVLYQKKKNKIHVKLCDFGISQYSVQSVTHQIGTYPFLSPQNLENQEYALEKNETWCLGLLLFCLLKGKNYYNNNKRMFNIKNDHHQLIDEMKITDLTKDLLKNLLQYKQEDRWLYQDIKKSKWYTLFGSNKATSLEKIPPILRLRQDYFDELTDKLIQYQNLINTEPFLKQFQIPQELLLITIKNYELWSWKQLDKYTGSYSFEYEDQNGIENQKQYKCKIEMYEQQLIKITKELYDFFQYVKSEELQQQLSYEQNQIIGVKFEYWRKIIEQQQNISNLKQDNFFYQINQLNEIQNKLKSHLAIFDTDTEKIRILSDGTIYCDNDSSIQQSSIPNQEKIKNSQRKWEYQLAKFEEAIFLAKKKLEDEQLQNEKKSQIQIIIKEYEQQKQECDVALNQKREQLEILQVKVKLEEAMESLKQLQTLFWRFFKWKEHEGFARFFQSQK